MSSEVSIALTFGGDDEVLIEFPEENVSISVPITRVAENLYRLDAVPVFVEGAGFRDVVEAEPVGEG